MAKIQGTARGTSHNSGVVALLLSVGVLAILEALVLIRVINPYVHTIICYGGVIAISALGLNLIYGYTGQFSLGHAGFYGLGAYASALVVRQLGPYVWSFACGVVVGSGLTGVVALLIGIPILRLKSDYLGIATLGFGMIVNVLLKNSDRVVPVMGGSCGMRGVARLTNLPWVFMFLIAAVVVLRNLVYSGVGRALLAVRDDELAAEAVGINAAKYKTMGFVIGCVYAGLAGSLYAHLYGYLSPDNFDFLKSIDVLLVVVLGGLGSMSGTVVAALAWVALLEGLRIVLPPEVQDWRMVVYPLLLIVFMLVRPGGIFAGTEFPFLRQRGVIRR